MSESVRTWRPLNGIDANEARKAATRLAKSGYGDYIAQVLSEA